MLYVGSCPVCGDGLVGVRVCCGGWECLLICDECDAVWFEPSCEEPPVFPDSANSPCPRCGEPLWEPPARWADEFDVEGADWSEFVLGSTDQPDDAARSGSGD